MNLVRKMKINKITPVDFTEQEKDIIDFFTDKLKGLVYINVEGYDGFNFYLNYKKEFVLYYSRDINEIIFAKYIYTKLITAHVDLYKTNIPENEISNMLIYITNNVLGKNLSVDMAYFNRGDYVTLEKQLLKAYDNLYI